MSSKFPKLEELYSAIVNDCYTFISKKMKEDNKTPNKELTILEKDKNILEKLNTLQLHFPTADLYDRKYIYIANFCSLFIKKIYDFFSKNEPNVEVRYSSDYCLAYIALLGFRDILFNDVKDDEIFVLDLKEYTNFSKILDNYNISEPLKKDYEENSLYIKEFNNNINNVNNNLYIDFILRFDCDKIYYPKIIESINYNEKLNECDLNTTKDYSISNGKNLFNNNLENENNKNKTENINQINSENININNIKEKIDKKNENGTNEFKLHNNENNEIINNEWKLNIELEIKSLKKSNIKSTFDSIKAFIKMLEINEQLNYEKMVNTSYLNIGKKKIEYLENYNHALKNTVINFSNPYNLNFWRKISNIILKNIFIALNKKNFNIIQNKDKALLQQIRTYANDISKDRKKEILKKIKDYENDINKANVNKTSTDSHSADKERKFNLITIYNKGQADVKSSLSIDFLFYLKEKGNYIAHFDEKILNFLLFNDMNIAEDDEKESDTQNLNEKNNEIKNEIVSTTKENKICEKIDKKEKVIQIPQDKTKINLNQEYKGKKIFSGSELIQMLKNPTKFQQKVIQKKNLFDSIYRAVDDFKKEIGYKDSEEQIFKLKDISKDLDVNINELMKKIETNFVKDFANMKIDIKNIKKINEKEKENLDSYLKEIINIYLELQKLKEKINKKIIFYENVIKKYQKIKKDIENNESEVNEQINQINELIKKAASLIKISDIFQNYKIVLKDNISKFPEYREHPNIFNESNIDEFIINDLYEFLTTYLKDGEFPD